MTALVKVAKRVVRGVAVFLEVLFPEPADDTMALAEAVGVTPEQVEADELREYHLAICEAVELYADARVAEVGMQDFTFWKLELPSRGEPQ